MNYNKIVEKIKSKTNIFYEICDYFTIGLKELSFCSNTSRSTDDIRLNFYLNKDWVMKINSKNNLSQELFFEISKVIENYNKSSIYAPRYSLSSDGNYLYEFSIEDMDFVAWIEEWAPYQVSSFDDYSEEMKIEALKKTAKYMTINSNKDLMSRNSMWSIIELPVWDEKIDEKEENYILLTESLLSISQYNLISRLKELNKYHRNRITSILPNLKRCSIQGDLNASNILVNKNKFMGLIDFNMSGTEVNINNILNETRYSLSISDFESLTSKEIFQKMNNYRESLLEHIFKYYVLDDLEKSIWDDYRKIVDLFLWPNVSLWTYLISEDLYVDKVLELITLIIES